MVSIDIQTSHRTEFINITDRIEKTVARSGVCSGLCYIFTPHTTAGLTINENADPSVQTDILFMLNTLIPKRGDYAHGEGNSDAHVKSSIIGTEKAIIVENGKLKLGTWQGIYFCEFDGPRHRKVWVKIMKDIAT